MGKSFKEEKFIKKATHGVGGYGAGKLCNSCNVRGGNPLCPKCSGML